jgi:hypothetical protein
MLLWGPSDADEPSKDDEQKLVNVLVTSSGAATSAPPPSVRAGLMACSYNDARHSAQWVLQYLERLKYSRTIEKAIGPPFTTSCFLFFC